MVLSSDKERSSEYEGAAVEGRISAERVRLSESLSNACADDSLDALLSGTSRSFSVLLLH